MPVKFKPSHKSFVKGKGTKIEHFYIKNISKEELIEYINNSSGKPKIKQKASLFSSKTINYIICRISA